MHQINETMKVCKINTDGTLDVPEAESLGAFADETIVALLTSTREGASTMGPLGGTKRPHLPDANLLAETKLDAEAFHLKYKVVRKVPLPGLHMEAWVAQAKNAIDSSAALQIWIHNNTCEEICIKEGADIMGCGTMALKTEEGQSEWLKVPFVFCQKSRPAQAANTAPAPSTTTVPASRAFFAKAKADGLGFSLCSTPRWHDGMGLGIFFHEGIVYRFTGRAS